MKYLILLLLLVGCNDNDKWSPKNQVENDYPALQCTNLGSGKAMCIHRQTKDAYLCFSNEDNELMPYPFKPICLYGHSPTFQKEFVYYGDALKVGN